jgi:hypothetical protein
MSNWEQLAGSRVVYRDMRHLYEKYAAGPASVQQADSEGYRAARCVGLMNFRALNIHSYIVSTVAAIALVDTAYDYQRSVDRARGLDLNE